MLRTRGGGPLKQSSPSIRLSTNPGELHSSVGKVIVGCHMVMDNSISVTGDLSHSATIAAALLPVTCPPQFGPLERLA